jgi:hypothetical protein
MISKCNRMSWRIRRSFWRGHRRRGRCREGVGSKALLRIGHFEDVVLMTSFEIKDRKVRRGKSITGWRAAACLAAMLAIAVPGLAQHGGFHPAPPAHPASHAPAQAHPQPHPQQARPQARPGAHPQQTGHAGDWLRRYKDLPPSEQQKALHSDPAFQRLPAAQQQQLQQRLNHFSNLPPQQQLRMLNRMETWEHLTPEQQQRARQVFNQIKQLPPDRQRAVGTAIHDLRPMSPEQRERIINSDRFKAMFSDQERDMMRGAIQLPLAPPE